MRASFDFYETAPWQVDALVKHLPELRIAQRVWCPTVGDSSIVKRLAHFGVRAVVTNDIDLNRAADYHLNATDTRAWTTMLAAHERPDWIVDNLPFNVAHKIIPLALDACTEGVAFMARLSFGEPTQNRGPWLAAHPCPLQIVLERYSFTGDGRSDSVTTAWFVWSKKPLTHSGVHFAFGHKRGVAA